ncbi:hypothetical protein BHE74_00041529, partial [Ensete ventricosum]
KRDRADLARKIDGREEAGNNAVGRGRGPRLLRLPRLQGHMRAATLAGCDSGMRQQGWQMTLSTKKGAALMMAAIDAGCCDWGDDKMVRLLMEEKVIGCSNMGEGGGSVQRRVVTRADSDFLVTSILSERRHLEGFGPIAIFSTFPATATFPLLTFFLYYFLLPTAALIAASDCGISAPSILRCSAATVVVATSLLCCCPTEVSFGFDIGALRGYLLSVLFCVDLPNSLAVDFFTDVAATAASSITASQPSK